MKKNLDKNTAFDSDSDLLLILKVKITLKNK